MYEEKQEKGMLSHRSLLLPGWRQRGLLYAPTSFQGRPSFRCFFRFGPKTQLTIQLHESWESVSDAAKSQHGKVESDFCPCQTQCPSTRVHPCFHLVSPCCHQTGKLCSSVDTPLPGRR